MSKLIKLCAFLLFVLPMSYSHAQTWQSCDQWATYNTGGFTIYNNIWGSGAGSQCIWANSYRNWGVNADHPNTGGIKSYPNVSRDLSINVNDLGACNSSFAVSVPGNSGSYESTYDIWYNNYAYEVMLWMNWNGNVGPISYNYNSNGAVPEATNVSIGGSTWNVYRGNNGSNEVFSFLRTGETTSGSVDITAISHWIQNRGWFGNANLHNIQFGFEITSSAGGLGFTTTDYSVSCSNGGGNTTGYVRLKNRATGLYVDGMGRASNGANLGQWSSSSSYNQQWTIESNGSYVRLKNRATGLYVDGMGRSSNGSTAGQWSSSTSYNQQWSQETQGSYVRFRNRATGLYLDGMGRSSNGSDAGQWSNSNSYNQQWQIVSP
jgi:hypothetical protein